jgi:hypothetical protein
VVGVDGADHPRKETIMATDQPKIRVSMTPDELLMAYQATLAVWQAQGVSPQEANPWLALASKLAAVERRARLRREPSPQPETPQAAG